MSGQREIGAGINVMEFAEPITGRTIFLDSPDQVLDFIMSDDVESSIVISRGGTTTFVAPALTAGVRGLMTLQGAPESHLGILSREYGIPCVMSVTFTEGVETSRGEIIPADGTLVTLDIATTPRGRVLIDDGADNG
ncbi:unannotated protein [freshwater metagenome]|uniref:Unannotated protein n=1 Tax=freshwater metagenome TaxID=449393 RepID=A0A6J7ICP2_9ZZZZ|nr:hypothetical protein [Actinomycetota bacterium]MSW35892.1 hypothetical protein [Actinomycetota bacterium]